ncbi:MAG: hypothetical protein JWO82_1530 [Akkermansiaceae bacterium]|nr:hypothetical protein [Akkermansiaceae bacterium]
MSKRVVFTCLALLFIGLAATAESLSGLSRNTVNFNLGMLFIPISIILLMGWKSARTAAGVVFAITYVAQALGIYTLLAFRHAMPATLAGMQVSADFLAIYMVMYLAFLVYLNWMLYTDVFDEHLER